MTSADWIRFQRAFAWTPESTGVFLRAGHTPNCVIRSVESEAATHGRGRVFNAAAVAAGAANGKFGDADSAAADLRALRRLGARVLPLTSGAYPESLFALDDAPSVLLVSGEVSALSAPAVAIVGARAATRAGRAHARRLGRELAGQGCTVVSGLARGIDAEAHRGALEAGGRTVAVLASGIDRIYPPEHRALAEEITVRGAVVGEMPLGTAPRRELFPLRNRIISGLCAGVVVVEARRRSGSLITVRHALGQGREVFVVPGLSEGPFAEGSNRLLREGARAITCAADVLDDLRAAGVAVGASRASDPAVAREVIPAAEPVASPLPLSDASARILETLGRGPASRDELILRVELDQGLLACALLDLELIGRVVEERDGRFHLCWD